MLNYRAKIHSKHLRCVSMLTSLISSQSASDCFSAHICITPDKPEGPYILKCSKGKIQPRFCSFSRNHLRKKNLTEICEQLLKEGVHLFPFTSWSWSCRSSLWKPCFTAGISHLFSVLYGVKSVACSAWVGFWTNQHPYGPPMFGYDTLTANACWKTHSVWLWS